MKSYVFKQEGYLKGYSNGHMMKNIRMYYSLLEFMEMN